MSTKKLDLKRAGDKLPKDPHAVKLIEHYAALGQFGELELTALPRVPRYLVTYMKSRTGGRLRSATVVSVTNMSSVINRVFVSFFKGFQDNSAPIGTAAFAIPPDFTVDFGSRDLPDEITTLNALSVPQLTFDEGRAIVSSMYPEIGVSARVIYTRGDRDDELLSITDSNLVVFGKHNNGD